MAVTKPDPTPAPVPTPPAPDPGPTYGDQWAGQAAEFLRGRGSGINVQAGAVAAQLCKASRTAEQTEAVREQTAVLRTIADLLAELVKQRKGEGT